MGPGIIPLPRLVRSQPAAWAIGAALLAPLWPGDAAAQSFASGDVAAVLLEPASVVKVEDMAFGQIAPQGPAAGTVVLDPTPTPTCTASASLVRTGPCTAATFAVRGRNNMRVRIREMNAGVITLAGPGGVTMNVNSLTVSVDDMTPVSGGGNPSGNLGYYRITDANGMAGFRIGGTLAVGSGQMPGVYTGTLTVQITYN